MTLFSVHTRQFSHCGHAICVSGYKTVMQNNFVNMLIKAETYSCSYLHWFKLWDLTTLGERTDNAFHLDHWLSPQYVKGLYVGWWPQRVLQSQTHSIHRSAVICGLPLRWTAVVSDISV